MKFERSFELAYPPELVWTKMNDVHFVAQCLPGASIIEELGENRYKGRMSVKVGPMVAAFTGDVAIDSRPAEWTAVVSGKGADARSSSRASGSMTYKLSRGRAPDATEVDVVSEIVLAGALAQFGKSAIIQDIANRITDEFLKNFKEGLAPAHASASAGPPTQAPQSLDAAGLLWSSLKRWVRNLIRKLFGPPTERVD